MHQNFAQRPRENVFYFYKVLFYNWPFFAITAIKRAYINFSLQIENAYFVSANEKSSKSICSSFLDEFSFA